MTGVRGDFFSSRAVWTAARLRGRRMRRKRVAERGEPVGLKVGLKKGELMVRSKTGLTRE